MSDARWLDVEADVSAATEHFANAVALYDAGGFDAPGLDGYRAEMALMHAMQSAHTAAEAALLRVLRILDEERPEGDDWHARLIDRLARSLHGQHARPSLLSGEIAIDLHETRSFRHRATHSYGAFDVKRAAPSVEAARRLCVSLPAAVLAFRQSIDPSG